MININADIPNTLPPDSDHPTGSFRDETSPGQGDGTPLASVLTNDLIGARDALFQEVGMNVNGQIDTANDSQYLEALERFVKAQSTAFLVRPQTIPNNTVFVTEGLVYNDSDLALPPITVPVDGAAGENFDTVNTAGKVRYDLLVIDKWSGNYFIEEGNEGSPGVVPDYPDRSRYFIVAEIMIVDHLAVKILKEHIREVGTAHGQAPSRFDRLLCVAKVNSNGTISSIEDGDSGFTFSLSMSGAFYDFDYGNVLGYTEIIPEVVVNAPLSGGETTHLMGITENGKTTGWPDKNGCRVIIGAAQYNSGQADWYHHQAAFTIRLRGIK